MTPFAALVSDGPLLAAVAVSALAGLVSFLSPCMLPLVPGYVSYLTGIAGADLDAAVGVDPKGRPVADGAVDVATAAAGGAPAKVAVARGLGTVGRTRVRGRVLAGGVLFVGGFTTVFTVIGFAVGGLGQALLEYQPVLERVVGALIVGLGLAFLGVVPGLARDVRIRWLPRSGLAGAPVLGAVFGLGWVPCVSPTLAAVQGLAYVQGGAARGALLSVAYGLGLGLPFIAFGLGFRRLLGAFAAVRRHSVWVTRLGALLLVAVGLLLLTGVWNDLMIWLRGVVGPGEIGI